MSRRHDADCQGHDLLLSAFHVPRQLQNRLAGRKTKKPGLLIGGILAQTSIETPLSTVCKCLGPSGERLLSDTEREMEDICRFLANLVLGGTSLSWSGPAISSI